MRRAILFVAAATGASSVNFAEHDRISGPAKKQVTNYSKKGYRCVRLTSGSARNVHSCRNYPSASRDR
jgi:hypothetical protein